MNIRNFNVEAEHNELILQNEAGDHVIIPANKRGWVKRKLKEGCHGCIDNLIETLPVMTDYAEDGSIIKNKDKETFEDYSKRIQTLNPNFNPKNDNSYNYKGAYEAGLEPIKVNTPNGEEYHLPSRNPKTGEILKSRNHPTFDLGIKEDYKLGYETYIGKDNKIYSKHKSELNKDDSNVKEYLTTYYGKTFDPVEITAEAPKWLKYKRELEKGYPQFKENEYLKRFEPERHQMLKQTYEERKQNYIREGVAKRLLEDKPYNKKQGMTKYLKSLTPKEREYLEPSQVLNKQSKSYWDMIEQGLLSTNAGPVQFKSKQYSQKEAKESTPLDIVEGVSGLAAKPVQALANKLGITDFKTGKDKEYDFTDVLKGKQNDAEFITDMATDLTNLIGVGIGKQFLKFMKLGNINKANKLLKINLMATEEILTKDILDKIPVPKGYIDELSKGNKFTQNDIVKIGDNYIKNINTPKVKSKLRNLDKEYGTDLHESFNSFINEWENGRNILWHDKIGIGTRKYFKELSEKINREPSFYIKGINKPSSKYDYPLLELSNLEGASYIPKRKSYINPELEPEHLYSTISHEIAHDINKGGEHFSEKLNKEIQDLFYKSPEEAVTEQNLSFDERGLKIMKDELAYLSKPTEVQSYLSTNLRQELYEQGLIKDINDNITLKMLEDNRNKLSLDKKHMMLPTWNRYRSLIKDKKGMVRMINKFIPATIPFIIEAQRNKK